MNILITICARAGSKGIPGKNTKLLNGNPLISYSINSAKRFAEKFNSKITISTDDPKVIEICDIMGIRTDYLRPKSLATDDSGKVDVIADILRYEEDRSGIIYDFVLDLDITSPLRTQEDLEIGYKFIVGDQNAINLFSVNPANKSPYFNMVEKKDNGYFGLVKNGNFLTRQSASPVYELNASFYFYKRSFFEMEERKVINDRSIIYLMDHICFDLDHQIDFEFMSYLIQNNKIEFQF
jgi:CMP-N-acetylneuraminic acid synthetase